MAEVIAEQTDGWEVTVITIPQAHGDNEMDMQTALQEVERAAGDVWNAAALAAIKTVARRQTTVHVDDVLTHFQASPPNSRRAWGPVWLRAVKAGYIEPTNEIRIAVMPAQINPESHPGVRYRIYKSLICEA